MASALERRLFPLGAERAYRALLRRRLRVLREMLLERAESVDPLRAVEEVRLVAEQWELPMPALLRTARAAVQHSSNGAIKETLKQATGTRQAKEQFARAARLDARQSITPIALSALEIGADVITKWAQDNATLITKVTNETLNKIAELIVDGLSAGITARGVGAIIRNRFGIADRRAKLIARDQMGSLNAQITQRQQTRLGVERYIWQTSEDERVRPTHRALNGTVQRWDRPVPGEGHPGDAINCRCVALPVFEGERPDVVFARPPGLAR